MACPGLRSELGGASKMGQLATQNACNIVREGYYLPFFCFLRLSSRRILYAPIQTCRTSGSWCVEPSDHCRRSQRSRSVKDPNGHEQNSISDQNYATNKQKLEEKLS